MASLNDTINAITGRLLANPLAPLVEASERERGNRDKVAAENRMASRAMDLEERRAALEEKKAMALLKLRNEFDEQQGKLNREGRLEEIKAQASAYVDRLTEADKRKEAARLRSLGIELSGKDLDEQLADGLKKQATGDYPKARGAVGIQRDYENRIKDLDSKITTAEKEDRDYISKTAKSLAEDEARKSVDGMLKEAERKALGGTVSAASIRGAKGIPTARRNELLTALEAATLSNQSRLEVGLTSSQLDRPTGDALRALRNEKMKAESEFSQFRNSDSGKLAMDRILFERGSAPAAEAPLAARLAAGVEAFDAVRNRIAGGAAGGGAPTALRPAMGDRQASEQAMALAAQPSAAASPVAPEASASAVPMAARSQLPLVTRMLQSPDPNVPNLIPGWDSSVVPAIQGFADAFSSAENMRTSLDAAFAPVRRAGNAIGRAVNPAIDARAAAIWGPDAVPLLKEAEQLATSRGMDTGEQEAIFNAAINGDANAQSKVALMLDYVRQAKQADQTGAFQPLMPLREYPGNVNTAPMPQGPSFLPMR